MLELFAWVALFGFCAAHRCCVGILRVRKSNERHTNWPEVGSFFWHKSVHQILLHHMLVKCILMYDLGSSRFKDLAWNSSVPAKMLTISKHNQHPCPWIKHFQSFINFVGDSCPIKLPYTQHLILGIFGMHHNESNSSDVDSSELI
jgi:hypothetical protein